MRLDITNILHTINYIFFSLAVLMFQKTVCHIHNTSDPIKDKISRFIKNPSNTKVWLAIIGFIIEIILVWIPNHIYIDI